MTRVKFCGLKSENDILSANELCPDYIGFVFVPSSKRYVSPARAKDLKALLSPEIKAVGVFADEDIERVSDLLGSGVIDIAQLHGREDDRYIKSLKAASGKPIIKAFSVREKQDIIDAEKSSSDIILLDSACAGSGKSFDWELLEGIKRSYFLAGGLKCENVREIIKKLSPFALDVSSGIETNGIKDKEKMRGFLNAVRER